MIAWHVVRPQAAGFRRLYRIFKDGIGMALDNPGTLRVLIADDHDLVLDTLGHFLCGQADLSVTTAHTLDEAMHRIAVDGPFDVVLLDYQMPGMNGLAGLEAALLANRGKVALMAGSSARPLIDRALEVGACGYIPKTLPARSLLSAVRFIASGEVYLPAELVAPNQTAAGLGGNLKPIEVDVLMHLCEGRQNKEIGHLLGLTEVTIKMHVKSVCGKLGASNRTQAVIVAKRENFF